MSPLLFCLILYQYNQVNSLATDVRLSQGSSNEVEFKTYEGAIEVLVNGTWGPILRHGVDSTTAKTICKILGHGFTGFVVERFAYVGVSLLNGLSCIGNETSIKECTQFPSTYFGERYEAPGVHCFAQVFSDLRLTDGEGPNNGTVNIKMDGRWGLLCGYPQSSGFSLPEIDLAICRTLGYQRTLSPAPRFGQYRDVYISWLDAIRISCNGDETNLNQCNFTEGTMYQPRCYSNRGVNCITLLNESCTSGDICAAVSNAVCTDNKCKCRHGYLQIGMDKCTECEMGFYGPNCTQCDCHGHGADACNISTGACYCKPGWTDDTCSTDIDECLISNETCPEQFVCINQPGYFICECSPGYIANGSFCKVCDDGHYGQNCSQLCDCELNNVDLTKNTRACDAVTGICACKSDWTGRRCDIGSTSEATDTQMLIIIISSAIAGCLLLLLIVTVCVYKYRNRVTKGSSSTSQQKNSKTLKTGVVDTECSHNEHTATMQSADGEDYNTINDYMVDVDINADAEYDIHPDLLERSERSDGRTDEDDGNDSDGYLKPVPTNTGTGSGTRLETDKDGYLIMDNTKRQLPRVPIDDQSKSHNPYEGLKDRRQTEHEYGKMAGT